jgi:hypothetical protein
MKRALPGPALRVCDRLGRERLEELLDQQHGEDVLAEDHAGLVFVGELRVERVAEPGEELDRQVDEDLVGHERTPGLGVGLW